MKWCLGVFLCLSLALTTVSAEAARAVRNNMARINASYTPFRGVTVIPVEMDGKRGSDWIRVGLLNADVTPGKHTFLLGSNFTKGLFGGISTSRATVTAVVRAGVQYKAVGKVVGDQVQVWLIELKSGKRISSLGSAPYSTCYPNQYYHC